ncbi:MAG: hypothetical protein IPG50_00670 [Myxococcales bacterium]|nr:hypothetical protein [Myxococcales bacterium]
MRLPRSLVAFVAAPLIAVACAKAEPTSHLAAQDLAPAEGEPFDANHILTLDELTDSSVTGELLRALITYRATEKTSRKNPYGRDSFLATYFSNGLSAIDALLNASEQYRINPLVLLVRAEMAEGLVALDYYPIDAPGRVEYLFRCGCRGPGTCDAALAGFDRQVDCLARQYRIILTDMENNGGVTAGGWAKEREGRTVDGKSVTPADEGTAAMYQFDPRVGALRGRRQPALLEHLEALHAGRRVPRSQRARPNGRVDRRSVHAHRSVQGHPRRRLRQQLPRRHVLGALQHVERLPAARRPRVGVHRHGLGRVLLHAMQFERRLVVPRRLGRVGVLHTAHVPADLHGRERARHAKRLHTCRPDHADLPEVRASAPHQERRATRTLRKCARAPCPVLARQFEGKR